MSFVQFNNLSLAFGDRDILKNASIRLSSSFSSASKNLCSRSALAGANGSGKSTLLKIVAGLIKPDSGDYAIQKGTRIGYLPQSGIVHHGKSLREEMETSFDFAHNLIYKLENIGKKLENTENNSDNEKIIKKLLEEHHEIQEKINDSGYYAREAEISSVLSGLGFNPNKDLDRDTTEFSGGWQMRIALAKILLGKPDILLLDEPTNYLDIEARNWLENHLINFNGGYLLVSHDRYFLDVCVNEVYEIFNGKLTRYAGNFSNYEKTRKIELEDILKKYAEQQEEIEKTENLIRRFRYKASKASFAQELIKRLEKMEKIEIPESLKKININFPPAPHSGKIALTLENISKSYNEHKVISNFDLIIEAGERLVVAGPNGAGKTTLLKIISGLDSSFTGNIKYGSNIREGYFSQDAAEALNADINVLEFIEQDAPMDLIPKIRDMLGSFLFRKDDVYKSVKVLSGGEKSRLSLLKLLLKPLNLLILDEPTNHLDLNSKDILLDALSKFSGTIIFVSHDRYFMEKLSTKVLELPSQKLYYGNYAYYLDKITTQSTQINAEENKKINNITLRNSSSSTLISSSFKQQQILERKKKKQEEKLLSEIEELEKLKHELENELSSPEVYSNGEKAKEVKEQLDNCILKIDEKLKIWEDIN